MQTAEPMFSYQGVTLYQRGGLYRWREEEGRAVKWQFW
jgi:hypothetical protein